LFCAEDDGDPTRYAIYAESPANAFAEGVFGATTDIPNVNPRRIRLTSGTHTADNFQAFAMTVRQKVDLCVDVVNGVDYKIKSSGHNPLASVLVPHLIHHNNFHPRCNFSKKRLEALNLWCAHVLECCASMSVQA